MTYCESRLQQLAAALDDARTIAADIQDEVDCPPLTDLRRYVNWALSANERADAVLFLKRTEGKPA